MSFVIPDMVVESRPGFQYLTRAAINILAYGPPEELEETIVRANWYLTYSQLVMDIWRQSPLMANMKLDLSSPNGRAR